MRTLAICVLTIATSTVSAAPLCRHDYSASKSGIEVNSTPCDHAQPIHGVKAICRDGTQSFSKGSGVCSHHGGISKRF